MKSMYLYQENRLKAARRPVFVFGDLPEGIANDFTKEFAIEGGELRRPVFDDQLDDIANDLTNEFAVKSMGLSQENSLTEDQIEDIINGLTDEFVVAGEGIFKPLDSEDNTNRKPVFTAAQEPVF